MKQVNVGVVGGTGYTGVELLRLLINHPHATLTVITSRAEAGVALSDMFPSLRGLTSLSFSEPDVSTLAACDVVFFATPHNVAMRLVPELLAAGTRVIDLSADFRLKDAEIWSEWYGEPHACPELLAEAVYGLPEVNREAIRDAQLVACAGCYPTAIQLGLMPLLKTGWVNNDRIIANAVSGASGAGKSAKVPMLMAEAGESFKAYGASGHRHLPEIQQGLSAIAEQPVAVTFIPHLVPMVRGIHATLYSTLTDHAPQLEKIQAHFEHTYASHPFVDVMPLGSHPETRDVRGSNMCRISLHQAAGGRELVVLSVIDNLVKGASGQALQCMNLMFGYHEQAGLNVVALAP